MSRYTGSAGPDPSTGNNDIDLHLVVNGRWAALDLDELLEQLVIAGFPAELICTYQDPSGRRRYVRRHRRARRSGRQEVTA